MLGLGNTLSGGIVPAATASFTNTYSLDFDGSDDYMISDSTIEFGEEGSYAFWMKTSTLDSMVVIYARSDFYFYATVQAGKVVPFISHPVGNFVDPTSTELDDGAWHFITVTTEGSASAGVSSTVKLYVDANLKHTNTVTNTYTPVTEQWEIGHYNNGACCQYTGNIDEIAIWANTTLDADAIEQLYNNGAPIDLSSDSGNYDNSGDLTHWWRMGDDDTFTTITDNAGGNDMEMTNMTSGDIVEDIPG